MSINQKIKEKRLQLNLSQQELAENAGVSLRTIQRIECHENTPLGNTLTKVLSALNMEQIEKNNQKEDTNTSLIVNLSAYSFLLFPLLGSIVPLITWMIKGSRVNKSTNLQIIVFQALWSFLCIGGYFLLGTLYTSYLINQNHNVTVSMVHSSQRIVFIYLAILFIFNFGMITFNNFRIRKGKNIIYLPFWPKIED